MFTCSQIKLLKKYSLFSYWENKTLVVFKEVQLEGNTIYHEAAGCSSICANGVETTLSLAEPLSSVESYCFSCSYSSNRNSAEKLRYLKRRSFLEINCLKNIEAVDKALKKFHSSFQVHDLFKALLNCTDCFNYFIPSSGGKKLACLELLEKKLVEVTSLFNSFYKSADLSASFGKTAAIAIAYNNILEGSFNNTKLSCLFEKVTFVNNAKFFTSEESNTQQSLKCLLQDWHLLACKYSLSYTKNLLIKRYNAALLQQLISKNTISTVDAKAKSSVSSILKANSQTLSDFFDELEKIVNAVFNAASFKASIDSNSEEYVVGSFNLKGNGHYPNKFLNKIISAFWCFSPGGPLNTAEAVSNSVITSLTRTHYPFVVMPKTIFELVSVMAGSLLEKNSFTASVLISSKQVPSDKVMEVVLALLSPDGSNMQSVYTAALSLDM